MAHVVVGVRVVITEYLSDEPQPGIVRCEFTDIHGRRWTFTEKTAIVSMDAIDGRDRYPRPGVLMCKVVGCNLRPGGDEVVTVESEYFPDGVESDEETIRFEVRPETLVEWDW